MTTINKAVKELSKSFPGITGIKQYGDQDAIFLGDVAEGGLIDDISACDYYNEDYKEVIYVFGVHKKLRAKLNSLGFYAECFDPGTYVAYRS